MPKNIKITDGILNVSSPDNAVSMNVDGNLVLSGNLTVHGDTTTINSDTLEIADNQIVLNSDFDTGTPTENAGIQVLRGSEATVEIRWNESQQTWQITNDGSTYSDILSGSGTLGDYAQKSVDETITGLWTFDNTHLEINDPNDAYVEFNAGIEQVQFGYRNGRIQLDYLGMSTKNYLTINTNFDDATTDLSGLTSNASNFYLGASGPMTIDSPNRVELGTVNSVTFDFTRFGNSVMVANENLAIFTRDELQILDEFSDIDDPADGTIELGRIEAPINTGLTLKSGNGVGQDGADLQMSGGSSDVGFPGRVIIGDQPGPSEITTLNDLTVTSTSGSIILSPAGSVLTNNIEGSEESSLSISGGESLTSNPGGNLVLSGGTSASGPAGSVIINSDTTFNGNVTISGTIASSSLYPLQFFIPALITTGSNPGIIMASTGVTDDLTIQGSGHVAYANVPPTGATTYIIRRFRTGAGTQIGSVAFLAGNPQGSVSITDSSLLVSDLVQIINPASPDPDIDDVTITLRTFTV